MTLRLRPWTGRSGERRVYLSGTSRDHNGLYATPAKEGSGHRISSRVIDQPAGRVGSAGTAYQRREQDREAAREALRRLGIGEEEAFETIWAMATGAAPVIEIIPP